MTTRVQLEDSYETIAGYLESRGMTDGLPVVAPTEDRVAAMIEGSGRPADHVVAEFPPINAPATIEKIAVNSVMAGCEPAYMPAIVAVVEVFLDPAMNAHAIQTTTNPVGPMILFNGPVRQRLSINYGTGAFGPGVKANATIGRALRLMMLNVGGATPGEVDKAALGWPGKYSSCCVGENEEDSPWEPYHVEQGFAPEDSTVTIIPASGMWPITETSPKPEMALHHVTHGMATSGHSASKDLPEMYQQVLVMSPVIAQMVAEVIPSKSGLKSHLYEQARVPLDSYPPYRHARAKQNFEKWGMDISSGRIPLCRSAGDFIVLCIGGMGGLQSAGMSCMLSRALTRKIEGL